MEAIKGLALIAAMALVLGLFSKQEVLPVPGNEQEETTYKPIRTDEPLPKSIFGLKREKNGTWTNSAGTVVYRQARVYGGGSRPRPLAARKVDGCTYKEKPVVVRLDSNRYPASALHIYIGARNGVPQTLHINRDPGYDIRSNSLEGIPSNSTYDRDESPFALSNEAAVYNRDRGTSDIAYIPFSDNRGSGSSMGNQLSRYCDGQSFRIQLDPPK
jgi:hypothetical protein